MPAVRAVAGCAESVESVRYAVRFDVGPDIAHPGQRVVPAVAFMALVGLEQPAGDPRLLGGAVKRLAIVRIGVEGHDQRVISHRREGRRLAPIVDVGGAGPPGVELGRRDRQMDAGVARPLPVFICQARRRVGVRHGAVDGQPSGLAHLVEKRGLHGFLSSRQHQFQFGTGADIGADRPGPAIQGDDVRQAHRQGEPMEVEVGIVVTPAAVLEGAEHDAAPGLGMDSAVEEGAAVHGLAVEGHGQRIMQRRAGEWPPRSPPGSRPP